MVLLVGAGRADRPDLEAARVETLGQHVDGGALAGCIPALEQDDDRHAVIEGRPLQVIQPALQQRLLSFHSLRFISLPRSIFSSIDTSRR